MEQKKTCRTDLAPGTILYRFLPFRRLLGLLQSDGLYVGRTAAWEDTYENFLAKAKITLHGQPLNYRGYIDNYFGQSWTLCAESDALWRIYSPDKTGVRISVKAADLEAVCLAADNKSQFKSFSSIRPVAYLEQEEIHEWMCEVCKKFIPHMDDLVDSLFIKRKAFEHEREARLVIKRYVRDENTPPEKCLIIPVDANSFIQEIMFDPRLSKEDASLHETVLKAVGFRGAISQSQLYGDVEFAYRF